MPDRFSSPGQAISDEIARLYRARIGRGPSRVSTTIVRDLVVCVMEDTHTPVEATMFEIGAHDLVHDVRRRFQTYAGSSLIEIVERHTGREVQTYVPGYTAENDVAVETFLLRGGDDYGTEAER